MAFEDTDPFTATGGGMLVNGGWVPNDHPIAINEKKRLATPQLATAPGLVAAPGANGARVEQAPGIVAQADKAATFSATPGAAPLPNTTNQGTQDVVRNSYLTQATQGTKVDTAAPEFRQQTDAFSAGQDRARRQYESEAAERLSAQGLGSSGAMTNERRLGAERAGQASGAFEAQLVGRELETRRDEIKEALSGLRGMISGDQAMALQTQLAELDAAIKREGIAQGGDLGGRELNLKDKLGTGALNVDLMRALLQNQQFGTDAGIRIGEGDADFYLHLLGLK